MFMESESKRKNRFPLFIDGNNEKKLVTFVVRIWNFRAATTHTHKLDEHQIGVVVTVDIMWAVVWVSSIADRLFFNW